MTARPLGRRPGATRTREDILDAARELFAEKGFERATMRAIAQRAGVDPALLHHYFGTKDDLLVAAVSLPFDPGPVLAAIREGGPDPGARIVTAVVTLWDDPATQAPMRALLRTAVTHERAAEALRDLFVATLLSGLAGLAVADRRELRAALVGSQVGGLVMARYVLRLPPLADLTADELARTVGPVLDRYLTGDLPAGTAA